MADVRDMSIGLRATPEPQTDGSRTGSCCTPAAPHGATVSPDADRSRVDVVPASGRHTVEQALVPSGSFLMGDSTGDRNRPDGEVPLHAVELDDFSIDATTVTNDDFAKFVADTGFVTDAERFGWSAVFRSAVRAPEDDVLGPAGTSWWWAVRGALWRRPGGSGSSLAGLGDHPVVHVSWNDAMAYCAWAGRRLPTEAEWEYASRGGLHGKRYPWGDDLLIDGQWRANIWQGEFPERNTLEDGWLTTAPVRTYAPNGYGLWQTVGNVWEWCADWFDSRYYRVAPRKNPPGPARGSARVLRGGSYLCHDSYCNRYRNSARTSSTPDSSMGNAGFRTVAVRRPGSEVRA